MDQDKIKEIVHLFTEKKWKPTAIRAAFGLNNSQFKQMMIREIGEEKYEMYRKNKPKESISFYINPNSPPQTKVMRSEYREFIDNNV